MNQKEKELFKSLCSFKQQKFDETLLSAATPTVLGQLFFNRMQAVAYGVLKEHGLLNKVNREFRNSLKTGYEQQNEKNQSYFKCLKYLQECLQDCTCNYALLKGAYLCAVYPTAYRTSNDIDILVAPQDVTAISRTLYRDGFRQGDIRNGKFEPATRKEIIVSKMMRGETVPFIKEVNLPSMKFLEIDINFSLDYKPGDTELLTKMLDNATVYKINDKYVRTLRKDDFFIHLCSHLYKEATTLPWIEMKRDMTLYKYCDIYMLLNDASMEEINLIFERAKENNMEKICAFAVLQTAKLFNFTNNFAILKSKQILKDDPEFIHRVISPKDKKEFIYKEKNILTRLFSNDRRGLIVEVDKK